MINITSANGVVTIVITDNDARLLQEAVRLQVEYEKGRLSIFAPDNCSEFLVALQNLRSAILHNV